MPTFGNAREGGFPVCFRHGIRGWFMALPLRILHAPNPSHIFLPSSNPTPYAIITLPNTIAQQRNMPPLQRPLNIQERNVSEESTVDVRSSKKTISFLPQVNIRRTIALNMFTQEELAATWYSSAELKRIRTEIKATISDITNGTLNTQDTDAFCLRGLESFLPEGNALKHQHRVAAREVVFDEQELQWANGQYDVELLADLYFYQSRESVEFARVRGLTDETFVALQDSISCSTTSEPQMGKLLPMKRPHTGSCRSSSLGSRNERTPKGVSSRAA